MAEITVELIKTLRDKTNAGMMDCKAALTEANGDLAEAETILRKKRKETGLAGPPNRVMSDRQQGLRGDFASFPGDPVSGCGAFSPPQSR